jgi:hypothetical protein
MWTKMRGSAFGLCASMCADLRRLRRVLRNGVWPNVPRTVRPMLQCGLRSVWPLQYLL